MPGRVALSRPRSLTCRTKQSARMAASEPYSRTIKTALKRVHGSWRRAKADRGSVPW